MMTRADLAGLGEEDLDHFLSGMHVENVSGDTLDRIEAYLSDVTPPSAGAHRALSQIFAGLASLRIHLADASGGRL